MLFENGDFITTRPGARSLDPEYPKWRTDANKESRMAPISRAEIY